MWISSAATPSAAQQRIEGHYVEANGQQRHQAGGAKLLGAA